MQPSLAFTILEDRLTPDGRSLLVSLQPNAAAELLSAYGRVEAIGYGTYKIDGASETAIDELRSRADVESVGIDRTLSAAVSANDPQAKSQWALDAVGAPAAWNASTGTGQTIVAVIDTGIDLNHADLKANLWRNPGEIAGNSQDDDGNGYDDDIHGYDFANGDANPQDGAGHGTHVAGTVGAAGNNGKGTTGIAWKTRLMALQFMDANGNGTTSGAIRAMDYAVKNGAKIINNSWGAAGGDPFLAAAFERARAAGVIVVNAAGNDGENADVDGQYPANYARPFDNAIAVAATDASGKMPGWSNYGSSTVLLAAPGSSILSTVIGGGTGTKSGTSMAAPHVSGALALLWDKNPSWTYQQVLTKLKSSVDVLPSLKGKVATGGELDLAKLLDATSPPVPPVVTPAVPPATTPPAAKNRQAVAGKLSSSTIRDHVTSKVTFAVSATGTANAIQIELDATHGRSSDLQIRLTAPDGRRVVLFNRRSGAGFANIRFDDAATKSLSIPLAANSSVKPEQSLSTLSGAKLAGTWTLEIFDVVKGTAGSIRSAKLSFVPSVSSKAAEVPQDRVYFFPLTDRYATFAGTSELHPAREDRLVGPRQRN